MKAKARGRLAFAVATRLGDVTLSRKKGSLVVNVSHATPNDTYDVQLWQTYSKKGGFNSTCDWFDTVGQVDTSGNGSGGGRFTEKLTTAADEKTYTMTVTP